MDRRLDLLRKEGIRFEVNANVGVNVPTEELRREFDAILGYVGEVKDVSNDQHTDKLENVGVLNVMREDGEPHESGLYTGALLAQAPQREGEYIKVKKIL